MSVKKYLTLSGLTYFFNKIKAYLTSSTYLNSIGISNTDIDDIADDAGYSSGSLPASEDIFITGDIIPNTDNSVDLGASSKNIKMIYTKGITINGTQFLPSDYIPKAGGAVIDGSLMPSADNSYDLGSSSKKFKGLYSPHLYGSSILALQLFCNTSTSDGSYMQIGSSWLRLGTVNDITFLNISTDGVMLYNGTRFIPSFDNNTDLGYGDKRWKTIYAATGTINTSDSRLKNSVKDIDDKLLDAWENIQPKQYKFNDATETKGEQARFHTGYLAQDIQAECEKQGVNASDYGLFCYDEWEEQEEISEEIETEKDGKKVKEKRIIQPKREKGNIYALRYEEALVVECAYLRRENFRLKENLASLEERLEKLENSEK